MQHLNDGQMRIDGILQANDGKMLVNDGEMIVNDGEMSVLSYTNFTIIYRFTFSLHGYLSKHIRPEYPS